ncbi:MAG: hypothetical protein F6K11_09395 [Leptolyngbya sp. SIO3F4]|nr:hypothetical protein [Leptolyngbya sp. SIO3F4]
MEYAYSKRRKITGLLEIPPGHEIIDTNTYAKRYFLSVRAVRYQCKCGTLNAYKVAGKWRIVTNVISNPLGIESKGKSR